MAIPRLQKKEYDEIPSPPLLFSYPILLPENHHTLKCFFRVFAKKIFFTQKPRCVYTIYPLVNNAVWSTGNLLRDFRCSHHTQKMVILWGRYVHWIDYNNYLLHTYQTIMLHTLNIYNFCFKK